VYNKFIKSVGLELHMLNRLYKNPQFSAYILIIFMAVFSTIYNAYLPLHGDEAYYWMWSHHLQTGYYDHPPMIAYLIYLTNFISESEWGIRLVNVFSFSIAALYIFKLTQEIADDKTALNAIIIFFSVILVHAGYIITTTDAPIILFWTLSLYYSYRALFYGSTKDFILAGLMLGLMMLSKYTAILLIASIFIFILIKRRDIFLNYRFYIAMILAFLVVSPMLYWNYQNNWISFGFQIDHGSTDDFKLSIGDMLAFIAGQFAVFSPVFFWVLIYYLFKEKLFIKNDKLFFIALSSVVILAFFIYKDLYKSMGLNYSAPAYIGGVILVAYIISKYELKKTFKIGLIIALIFTLLGRIAFFFYLDRVQERMYASDKIVERFATHIKDGDKLYGGHLSTAAYIKYYVKGHPETDVAIDERYSQYDMWRVPATWHQDGLVLTRNDRRDNELLKYYANVELIDTYVVIPNVRVFYTYRVSNPKKVTK
jgi:4-amino-4-deoxy-L-arabinose transferase-like glycosyltransferase